MQSAEDESREDRLLSPSHLSPAASDLLPYYRLIGFGVLWFYITLSVESSVIPIADVIFEHRVYLSSVGAFLSIAASVMVISEKVRFRWPNAGKAVVLLFVAIIIILSGTTYARNIVWQDEMNLWEDVVIKYPRKARGHNNLGTIYDDRGMTDKAVEHYRIALQIAPKYADAHHNLGFAYAAQGFANEAIEEYKIALRLNPDHVNAHHNLGRAYASQDLTYKAIKHFKIALRINPDYADAHFNLGVNYIDYGSLDSARREFERALEIKPEYKEARQFLNHVNNILSSQSER